MGGKAPKAPPSPNPYAVAGAQTGSNVNTAVANAWIGNADEEGPLGSVNYSVKDYKQVADPSTGNIYYVPQFKRTTTLSPEQQHLLDQQNAIGSSLNDMALTQSQRLSEHLSSPVNLDGLPEGATSLNTDFEPYRARVEQGLMERMNPQLERDYSALENRLVNQGLVRGSEAFTQAMDENNRKANDARTQIFLASGNEARAASGEERARGAFNQNIRNQALQERFAVRNQPINEITALMNGGQVSMPQFPQFNAPTVAPTPIGDYIYKSASMDQQAARDQAQSNAQMWGTIGNLAGIGLYKWSDRRLKTDIRYVYTDASGIAWYTYRYLWSDKPEFGVIAQEVLDVRPEAVIKQLYCYSAPTIGEYYAVNYGAL